MKIARTMILALMLLTLGVAPLFADEATKFIRFKAGDKPNTGALQIAYAVYKSDKTDVTITLYGVVHIADMAYYQSVQKDLDSHDAVLYELVIPGKKKIKPNASAQGLGQMQKAMGELLGLSFQKDGINYKSKKSEWIHADMNMDELAAASGGDPSKALPGGGMFSPQMMKNLGPMLKMGMGFIKQMFKSNPAMRDSLKIRFAQQMTNADKMITGEMQRVIVVERNKKAMSVLDRELAKRSKGRLALFYGAAHNADFHERLAKRGFRQVKKVWKNAWSVPAPQVAKADTVEPTPSTERAQPRRKKAAKVEFYE